MILASFGFFLLGFVVIGLLSALQRERTGVDYLLASHSVKPWLVALSAVATNNSGYMFVGMIGFTYMFGWCSVWLMLGWIVGDFLTSLLVHAKLRATTEARQAHSFTGALSRWHGTDYRTLRALGGVVTVVFLGTYAAAQLNAGSKALFVLFGWDYGVGAVIGAVIVLLYCFAGGIRASIWTDAAQSAVMVAAMIVMCWASVMEVGGWTVFTASLHHVSPGYMSWFPDDPAAGSAAGPLFFVAGWLFAGFAVIGQPHIMVRFMAMDDPRHMWRVRVYYYAWFAVFYALTICAGLAARLLLPEIGDFDAELALPTLAGRLLPDVVTGLVLAGLFAATISTTDSLILSCTAAITRDFRAHAMQTYGATKLATVGVTVLALGIALSGNESVFSLVLISWSTLASAFGPLVVLYALGAKPREALAVAMMLTGVVVVIAWRTLGWDQTIVYEAMPGMLSGFLVFGLGRQIGLVQHVDEPGTAVTTSA